MSNYLILVALALSATACVSPLDPASTEAKQSERAEDTIERVLRVVAQELNTELGATDLHNDLFGDLGADGSDFVEIIIALEREFAIAIYDRTLVEWGCTEDDGCRVDTLIEVVRSALQSRGY